MQEVRRRFSFHMPVDREIAVLKDKVKSLIEGDRHIVKEGGIVAHESSVPLKLCEAGENHIGSWFAGISVVRPTNHILGKIERDSEFRAAGDQKVLFNKWAGRLDRWEPVIAIGIL